MNIDEWINIGIQNGIIDSNSDIDDFSMSFCDVYKLWINSKIGKVKPQTIDRIEVTYNKYYRNSFLNNMNPLKIKNDTLINFFRQFEMNKKEYMKVKQICLGVFEFLLINDYKFNAINWDKVNSFVFVQKNIKELEYPVPISDVEKLFNCVVKDKIYYNKQSSCLLLLLNFSLGLRIGELAVLTWDSIDLKNRLLYVNSSMVKYYERDSDGNRVSLMKYDVSTTKTSSGIRVLPLTDRAIYFIALIKEHHKAMHYKSKFLAYDGKDIIFVRGLDRTLRRLCVLCGVEYFKLHLIRKTFASRLHEIGIPTKTISVLLGHSDMIVTQRNYILDSFNNIDLLRLEMEKAV